MPLYEGMQMEGSDLCCDGILKSCQDGASASVCFGIALKYGDASVD
jgi:hypothetical protein